MVTAELLEPIVTAVQSNLTVIIPVGLGLMATILGVRLVPKFLKIFVK